VADIPGLGTMLLPAPKGFVDDGQFRLNPSYVPPQVVARLAHGFGEPWSQMYRNVPRLLIETSPHGLAPNWTRWVAQEGFKPANDQERTGSYDAIRVYLWVGMLDSQATDAQTLKDHFRAIGRFVDAQGYVTETINVMTGTAEGNSTAGPGFSAALLPLLQKSSIGPRLFNAVDSPREQPLGYYNQMLTLFGKGWFEGRFQFDKDGRLEPSWMHCQ